MTQIQVDNGHLICQKVFVLGLDFFHSQTTVNDLDQDKLQNIVTCEKKRLQRFANEFPHEQPFLTLQSLLIASLDKLVRQLADRSPSSTECLRQLSRIAVLVAETDKEVAALKWQRKNGLKADVYFEKAPAVLMHSVVRQQPQIETTTLIDQQSNQRIRLK